MTNHPAPLRQSTARRARAVLAAFAGLMIAATAASAQGWWPFGNDEPERPPMPREPVYRPDAVPAPQPGTPGAPGVPGAPGAQGVNNWSTRNPICLQLEQRLVQDSQKGSQSRNLLPQIEAEIRNVDRTYNVGASKLDRSCYEYFLFAKTFRNTPQCKTLAREVEVAKRRLAELEAQRQEIANSSGRSYQDDIIRELARNNCGANYVDQARRRDTGFWQDEESVTGNSWNPQGMNGVATYRTICVRLCDGYYFPVSFSTLPSHFAQDAEVCTSKCAAPTELYYYPNPGGSVDQSVALSTQEAYTNLKVAFRYRKEYVNGCSCKTAEYVPEGGDKKAEGMGATGTATKASAFPARRADIPAEGGMTTGSTAQPAIVPPPAAADEPAGASVEDGWAPP